MQAWVETAEGREALEALAELNERLWPDLFQELTGIAAGAGLPFTQVWLTHPFGRLVCPLGTFSELLQHSNASPNAGEGISSQQFTPCRCWS